MFKSLVMISFTLVVAAVLLASTEATKKEGGQKFVNMTCKGEQVNSKVFWVGMEECFKEIFPNYVHTTPKPGDEEKSRKEFDKKMQENELCMEVCKWKKQGILNADGTHSKEGIEKMVKAAFHANVQEALKKAFNECGTANGKSLSTDNKCASYKGLRDCKVKKFMEICEIKQLA